MSSHYKNDVIIPQKRQQSEDFTKDALSNGISQTELIKYVAQMTHELAFMCRESRLDLLAYFLDMAHSEATLQIKGTKLPAKS